uniref:Integrase catalytic domain-containing protein n=1 Tax=Strongyloides papillosus TaxID=174720 RepID=A0A0N5CBN3_STREA
MAPPVMKEKISSNPFIILKNLKISLFKHHTDEARLKFIFSTLDSAFFIENNIDDFEGLSSSELLSKVTHYYTDIIEEEFDIYDRLCLLIDDLKIDYDLRKPYSSFISEAIDRISFFNASNCDALIIKYFLESISQKFRQSQNFKDYLPDSMVLSDWLSAAKEWDKLATSTLVRNFRKSHFSNKTTTIIKTESSIDVVKDTKDVKPAFGIRPCHYIIQQASFFNIDDEALVDSACGENILSLNVFNKFTRDIRESLNRNNTIDIILPNGSRVSTIGSIDVDFSCSFADIHCTPLTFFVCDVAWNFLGINTCVKFRLLSKLEAMILENEPLLRDTSSILCNISTDNVHKDSIYRINKFLEENPALWDDSPVTSKTFVRIPFPENFVPTKAPLIRFAKHLREASKDILDDDVRKGFLVKVSSQSDQISNAFTIKQQGKNPRLVVNPKNLNNQIVIPSNMTQKMINTKDIQEKLANYYKNNTDYCFSTFDIKSAYRNCRLHSDQSKYLQFVTEFGTYEPTSLIFGLNVSSYLFIDTLSNIMHGIDSVIFYSDDGLVFTKKEDHANVVIEILSRLVNVGWKITHDKCQWMKDEVEFIGLTISKNGISIPEHKKVQYKSFSHPTNLVQIKQFVQSLNYYRSMIPEFSNITDSFYAMKSYKWTDVEKSKFNRIVNILSENIFLTILPSDIFSFSLTVQVSDRSICSSLYWHTKSNKGLFDLQGRTLKGSEINYLYHNKFLLAVKENLFANQKFILNLPVFVIVNNSPLKSVLDNPPDMFSAQSTFQRLRLFLEYFDVKFVYSREYDIISKLRIDSIPEDFTQPITLCAMKELAKIDDVDSFIDLNSLIDSYASDPYAPILIKIANGIKPDHQDLSILPKLIFKFIDNNQIVLDSNNVIRINNKIYVPQLFQNNILSYLHMYHRSSTAMIHLANTLFVMINCTSLIRQYYSNCKTCMYIRRSGPSHISSWPKAEHSRERWHADHVVVNGKTLLSMVDSYSNFLILYHLSSYSIPKLQEALINIFALYGTPSIIVFDNFPSFVSPLLKQFLIEYNVVPMYCIKYDHRSNGHIETLNSFVRTSISKFMSEKESFSNAISKTLLKNHTSVYRDNLTSQQIFFNDSDFHAEAVIRNTPQLHIVDKPVLFKIKSDQSTWTEGFASYRIGKNTYQVIDKEKSIHIIKDNLINFDIGKDIIKEVVDVIPISKPSEYRNVKTSIDSIDSVCTETTPNIIVPNNGEGEELTSDMLTKYEDLSTSLLNTSLSSPLKSITNVVPASDKSFEVISTEKEFTEYIFNNPQFKESYIFMDGSTKGLKDKPSSGIGYFAHIQSKMTCGGLHLLNPVSSDLTEVCAFVMVLENVKDIESPILFLTDSSYVYKAIANGYIDRLTSLDRPHHEMWSRIKLLYRPSYRIIQTASHSRHSPIGNKIADYVARAYSLNLPDQPHFSLKCDLDHKSVFKEIKSIFLAFEMTHNIKIA